MTAPPSLPNRDLFLPHLVPYLGYVLGGMFGDRFGVEIGYMCRIAATVAGLIWAWRWLVPLRGPKAPAGSIALGVAAGLVGTVLWIGLLMPFVGDDAEPWSTGSWTLRMLVSGTLPPLFEELFLTAFVLRFATQWDRQRIRIGPKAALDHAADRDSIADIAPGDFTPLALAITAVCYAAGHAMAEWPAGLAWSLLMSALWIARGDLIAPITAHAVTNVALAIYVRSTGLWQLW